MIFSNESKNIIIDIIYWILIILIVTSIIFLLTGYYKWSNKICSVECPFTKEKFIVQNNKEEPVWVRQEVASRLATLAQKVDSLVKHMNDNNLPDAIVAKRLASRWKKIRLNPSGFRETSPHELSAAYTLNKGEQMRICVRDRDSNQLFEDPNTSMFILAHELGHLMSKSYGHNEEFKQNFSFITKVAVELGLYKYQNFSKEPERYCGVDINHPAY
jgi:hypothetical protein